MLNSDLRSTPTGSRYGEHLYIMLFRIVKQRPSFRHRISSINSSSWQNHMKIASISTSRLGRSDLFSSGPCSFTGRRRNSNTLFWAASSSGSSITDDRGDIRFWFVIWDEHKKSANPDWIENGHNDTQHLAFGMRASFCSNSGLMTNVKMSDSGSLHIPKTFSGSSSCEPTYLDSAL